MFSFVDSRTVLLLVASQVVLLSMVRCQEEDDRKLHNFLVFFSFYMQKMLDCYSDDITKFLLLSQLSLPNVLEECWRIKQKKNIEEHNSIRLGCRFFFTYTML